MVHVTQLPCDCDGVCMACKVKPAEAEKLTCKTCATQWHVHCLSSRPATMAEAFQWECSDCTSLPSDLPLANEKTSQEGARDLIVKVRAIEADESLTETERAAKRQRLLSGKAAMEGDDDKEEKKGEGERILDILKGTLSCSICLQLLERPVTIPCGHNFCLKCFQKWVAQGKKTCPKCRSQISRQVSREIRINSALVSAIRIAKGPKFNVGGEASTVYHFLHNQDRPDTAYTTERAKKKGMANASSGMILVTVPKDHFGPIPPENDPEREQGVLVGECWAYRFECRQWGVHFPQVSGIAGQSKRGAQSVVLSGGYVDDEDHGEWFLYTGSGGRDLSGNKRTNNKQSFDQKFDRYNLSLKVSCLKGYPVRVLRSHKEKRSSYAPEKGIRYDGVYRIEKCWAKQGLQGFKVCRFLFVRCDNEPAPWTSDYHGDLPRPLPEIQELEEAVAIVERKEDPSWGFDEQDSCWKWKKPPPPSKERVRSMDPKEIERSRKRIRKHKNMSIRESLLRGLKCLICGQVLVSPVTTPCAHNFCKSCLEGAFEGVPFLKVRNRGGRTLRSQKNVRKCPACPTNISDYLENLQINRELMSLIESLKEEAPERRSDSEDSAGETSDGAETDSEGEEETDSDECSEQNEEEQ